MYNEEFRHWQHGQIGLTFACGGWVIGSDPNDNLAADTDFQFECGSIAHPIYIGDYPPVVKDRVAMVSAAQGYPTSRLPVFTPEWISYIRWIRDLAYSYEFMSSNDNPLHLFRTEELPITLA